MSLRQKLSDAVERVAEAVARFLAPAMPWLFLALQRALVATLVAVVVALVFFVMPQSREVLHGLGEPPLRSLQEFNGAASRHINLWAYLFYLLTAIGLSLATWYSARLLSTVEAPIATPNAMEDGDSAANLKQATTWLPRVLGVFVLAAAIGALLYASYTPRLTQGWALALVALAGLGPLLVSVGALKPSRVLQWAGVVVMLIAALLLYYFTDKWRIWLASTACSTLPAVLLWFLVKRRELVVQHVKSGIAQTADQRRGFGEVIVTLFMIVAGSVVLLLLLALLPTPQVRAFGSGAAVLLFLTAAVLLLAGAHILLRRAARGVPGLTLAAVALVSVLVAMVGNESLGEEQVKLAADTPAPAASPAAPAAAAPPRPLYVNAHGGGLRAATFTAQVLARADDLSCGQFGEQVAAFSGVSGGSLGIATYLLARQHHMQRGGWPADCAAGSPAPATPLTAIVVQALVQDHLSPTVARMLAVDAPHLPAWSPTRGQALLDSWQSALAESLDMADTQRNIDNAEAKTDDAPAAFALPLAALTGGMKAPLAVYFNATDADSGHIVWFSNVAGGQMRNHFPDKPVAIPSSFTVGQAVLHSARFPIVSPAGKLGAQRLVDGGYADNSGAITLLRVMLDDKPHGSADTPRLINIDGNPPQASRCLPEGSGKPPILTAFRALLEARSAHAALAVQHFKQAVGERSLDVTLDLEKHNFIDANQGELCEQVRRANHAPLGWYLSYGAATTMEPSVMQGADQICASLGEVCKLESTGAGRKP